VTTLWEVSFECGNKVGGIWTVITSKAAFMKKSFGKNYFTVGFHNPKRVEVLEKKPPAALGTAFAKLEKEGLEFHYGSWVDASDANIILIDGSAMSGIDKIKAMLWEKYGIDSLGAGHDFDEPIAWSYAVGRFLEEAAGRIPGDHVVQLHEWLSAGALFHLDSVSKVKLPTVFTTHATVLGRATGGNIRGDPDVQAKERGVLAKHLAEKAAARAATVFTTVSEATGAEAMKVLGRAPDVITYNAMDRESLPELPKLMNNKAIFRQEIDDFVRSYFFPYYSLNMEDYPVIYTAGRYEFLNKGYDIFIDALGLVNERLKAEKYGRWFLSFILVPAGTLGVKDEVIQNFVFYRRMKEMLEEDVERISEDLYMMDVEDDKLKKGFGEIMMDMKRMRHRLQTRRVKNPPLCAFQLVEGSQADPIMQRLQERGLLNRPEDRVKVVYYPVYLNKQDELLGLQYHDFLTAASMGVFLSRYEPWGYTPMEAAAFLSATVTTNSAGFGMASGKLGSKGIHIAESGEPAANHVADIIEKFVKSSKEVRMSSEIAAYKTVKDHFVWDTLGERYLKAYEMARKK
jgi:glycogen synthase